MAGADDLTKVAIETLTSAAFAWLRDAANPSGEVKILRGEVGSAAERLAGYLFTELADWMRTIGWPIKIEADAGAAVSITIEE